MRKKKGSILIEVMVSIIILSTACVFAVSTTSKCIREYKIRTDKEEINRAVNMIIKEIKYNIEQSKLDEMFNGSSEISLKYEDDMADKLYDTGLMDLESGNDIKISRISEDIKRSTYEVKVNVGENIDMDYEFCKSWWMDEI